MVAKYTATVVDGELVLDAPTDTKVDVNTGGSLDQLPVEERTALLSSVDEGLAQAEADSRGSRARRRASSPGAPPGVTTL